jgi:rhodanese-related sulfurtransferase
MWVKQLFRLIIILTFGVASVGCRVAAPPIGFIAQDAVTLEVERELSPNLSIDEVVEVISQNSAVVIDVRESDEFSSGHIPGAVLIPLGELADRSDEIPTDVPVILVCRSGNRSSQAYHYLAQQGFENIHNMLGGMLEWIDAGYQVVK